MVVPSSPITLWRRRMLLQSSGSPSLPPIRMPPTIEVDVKLIEGLIVKAGSPISLPAKMTGIPTPTAKWMTDDKEIISEGRYKIESAGSSTILSIPESQRGDTGEYILTVANPAGSKTVALHVTVLDLPGPPIGPINILEVTPDHMMIQWRAPKDDGGTPITNYVVEKKDVKKPWEYRVSGLFEGNSYEFRVFSENIAGISEPSPTSDPIKATRAITKPGPPGNPKLKDWSKSYADICWTKPTRDGGSPILGYVGRPDPEITWTKDARALSRDKRTEMNNNYPLSLTVPNQPSPWVGPSPFQMVEHPLLAMLWKRERREVQRKEMMVGRGATRQHS
uniref:Fibronectin type-III domain-containing protein n=1 Tax=Labrus bergylta TaxID=56723 RepID=A0A3Q3GKH6_9LABR